MFKYLALIVLLSVAGSNGVHISEALFWLVAIVTVASATKEFIVWAVSFSSATAKLKERNNA